MTLLVLDSGAVSDLAKRSSDAVARVVAFRREGLWPPVVPSVVLVESLTGNPGRDAITNRLLKTCDVLDQLPERVARRAAALRYQAGQGSAVDAIVVAAAEPGGTVLTGDTGDIAALSTHATGVTVAAL